MITNIILVIMAIEDLLTMKVHNFLQACLLLSIIFRIEPTMSRIILSIIIFVSYIIYEQNTQVKIGGADIKIVCILILGGITELVYILFWASLIGLIYSLTLNQKKIPFVPFIWIGYTIVNI